MGGGGGQLAVYMCTHKPAYGRCILLTCGHLVVTLLTNNLMPMEIVTPTAMGAAPK